MPFHRRFSRRNRPRRRRRPRRRMRRRRRVALDPERKFIDRTPGLQTVNFSGNVEFINGYVQGVQQNERIGVQALTLSSVITYTIRVNPLTNFAAEVRVALIHYKQPRQLILRLIDIWDLVGTAGAVIGPRVIEEALQYKILWSRRHRATFQNPIQTRTVVRNHRFKTRFTGPGGAFGDVQSGGLYFVSIAAVNVVGEEPTIEFHSRVRFVG